MFSAKAPMRIMQSRVLAKTGAQVEDFLGGIVELGDRLGPVVWQFDRGQRIERGDFTAFLEVLPREVDGRRLRHVLDVRDPAFASTRDCMIRIGALAENMKCGGVSSRHFAYVAGFCTP